MPAENEKIFIRKIKTGYIATYNGVLGKAPTMYKAILRAQRKWAELHEVEAPMHKEGNYDTATSAN